MPFLWISTIEQSLGTNFSADQAFRTPALIAQIPDNRLRLLFTLSIHGMEGEWNAVEHAFVTAGFNIRTGRFTSSNDNNSDDKAASSSRAIWENEKLSALVECEIGFWWHQLVKRKPELTSETEHQRAQELLQLGTNHGWLHFRTRLQILKGLGFVGVGIYNDGKLLLEEAIQLLPEEETYWRFRAITVLGTCEQAMGNFSRSEQLNAHQERLVNNLPCAALRWTSIRRRLSLLVESEQCEQAQAILRAYLPDLRRSSLTFTLALFLQEAFRIAILLDDEEQAKQLLDELEELIRVNNIPPSALSLVEERCEWDLRQQHPEAALEKIRDRLWQAQLRGEISGQIVGLWLCSRVLCQQQKYDEAYGLLKQAWKMCEEYISGRTGLKILLSMAAIEIRRGEDARAEQTLSRAILMPSPANLPIEGFSLRALKGYISRRPLAEALDYACPEARLRTARVKFLHEIAPWLDEIMEIRPTRGLQRTITLLRTSDLFGLFWNARQGRVYSFRGELHSTLLIGQEGLVDGSCRFILSHDRSGFALSDLHHSLSPNVSYNRLRHEPRLRSLLKRCQERLRLIDIEIIYDRNTGKYCLSSTLPIGTCRTTDTEREHATLRPKEKALLECIRQRGSISAGDLQRQFAVTRQTLHPMLKHLLLLGLIGRSQRARATQYFWRSNPDSH